MALPPAKPDLRKRPRQSRSQATVDAVLEAAARILERDGISAVNTNAVAELAGVSVGSLYQYFPDKEAIFAELIRRERGRLRRDVANAVGQAEAQSFEATIAGLLEAAIAHQLDRPALARALEYVEALLPLDDETQSLNEAIVADVGHAMRIHGRPDDPVTAQDVVAMTKGMVDAAGLAGETDKCDLIRRVERAVFGYLEAG
ncbi:TetR/AcrR family transcriptional regulator [uncultured Parvibaculum sp.]|uniref:TetR/AcrR family transcriptional regulator n=1 Tax=uncultured Parvibaculum sp. TaxID=291828 RepID=UPI0030DB3327